MVKGQCGNVKDVVQYRLCHGCGACSSVCEHNAIELRNFLTEGIRPVVSQGCCSRCGRCLDVCSGVKLSHDNSIFSDSLIPELKEEWGPVLSVWEGYAEDAEVRYTGSSGGVATALGIFGVEQGGMDGVLHIKKDPENPLFNKVDISHSRNALSEGAGSRYSPAALCLGLNKLSSNGSYVIIGKPCDIAAVRNWCKLFPDLAQRVGLTIAIFCGGTPSTEGTLEIFDQLGINKRDVTDLRYRGHGWPGEAVVALGSGETRSMSYQQAWDNILTYHKPFRCRICPDSTGEFADISCGDPWYRVRKEGEHGSSLIVVRTERGAEFLDNAVKTGQVIAVKGEPDILPRSQDGLLQRRRHVFNKLFWLRFFRLPYPDYSGLPIFRNWMRLSLKRKIVSFYQTGKWIFSLKRTGPEDFSKDKNYWGIR